MDAKSKFLMNDAEKISILENLGFKPRVERCHEKVADDYTTKCELCDWPLYADPCIWLVYHQGEPLLLNQIEEHILRLLLPSDDFQMLRKHYRTVKITATVEMKEKLLRVLGFRPIIETRAQIDCACTFPSCVSARESRHIFKKLHVGKRVRLTIEREDALMDVLSRKEFSMLRNRYYIVPSMKFNVYMRAEALKKLGFVPKIIHCHNHDIRDENKCSECNRPIKELVIKEVILHDAPYLVDLTPQQARNLKDIIDYRELRKLKKHFRISRQ